MTKQHKKQTIQAQIDYWAEYTPQKIACCFVHSEQQYTYQELRQICQRYTSWFLAHDINPGGKFALAMDNSMVMAELIYAAYYCGRVVIPLNLKSGHHSQTYVLEHSKPVKVFCHSDQQAQLTHMNCLRSEQIQVLEKNRSPLEQNPISDHRTDSRVEPEDLGLLIYTSGTTGTPKGVMLSQKNLLAGGFNTTLAHKIKQDDIGLCVLPLYHINAQCVSLMSCLVSGSTLILAETFSVNRFFSTVVKYNCTWASLVPTMISYLLNHIAQNSCKTEFKKNQNPLKFIRSASAPLPVEVHHQFEKILNIPIIETMGITETSAQILSNPRQPQLAKIGTVGIPYGNKVCITAQNTDGNYQTLATNQNGEIAIKGDNVMQGYYLDTNNTKKSFTPDGWFLSGDLGAMDENGYITVTGRKKEIIIKGGENISPREIDEILYAIPGVIEAAAFAKRCDQYGQTIEACVKLNTQSLLDEKQLLQICTEHLGVFKSPDKIHLLETDLPKGPSGKIQRLKLEALIYPNTD